MIRKASLCCLLFLLIILAACDEEEPPRVLTPSTSGESSTSPEETGEEVAEVEEPLEVRDEGVFISEVLPGVPGNNNREFLELYNAGDSDVDLQGWSLWYQLGSGQEETLVYSWDKPTTIPAYGHILLVRSGKDFGIVPDGTFDTPLFERKGGLALRDANENTADRVGWGDAGEGFFAGTAAPPPNDGASLERLPGGLEGSGVDRGDNAADFVAREDPDPQNSGSPTTPSVKDRLAITLEAPGTVSPGEELIFLVRVENWSGKGAADVSVMVPIPEGFRVVELPDGAVVENGQVRWPVGDMADGEAFNGNIHLQSPYTYSNIIVRGYRAEAEDLLPAYGPLRAVSVAGGSIPIANARELVGNVVTVEGLATMYTGGFFAGSTGTKFYLEDETGGIQVYVPGGMGQVNVDIGDLVQVTGEIELYRDSLELVPRDIPGDVEVIEAGAAEPIPAPISIADNERNEAVLGMLNTIEGTATQIEEFTYDYQIELTDDQGESTLVLIEKDTGVTAEPLDIGQRYRVTGISEYYSGARQIKPRLQSDLVPVFAPELVVALNAANSVRPGETLTYTIRATNHTPEALTDLHLAVTPPVSGMTVADLLDDGFALGDDIVWIVDILEGGQSVEVRYTAVVDGQEGAIISAEEALGAADQWPTPARSQPFLTFIGEGVPIWAIQGSGQRSPYTRSEATTAGVVTGVFPELNGFWIQEIESDNDPDTSAGLFVLVEAFEIPVAPGDMVRIIGKVREISSQTTLHVLSPTDIEIVESNIGVPDPVEYDPPIDPEEALVYKESLEGMLVTVGEPALVIGPTTRYGEYVLLRDHWDDDSVRRGEANGHFIVVDDGSEVAHENQSTLRYEAVARGDQVTGVTGPLAYTFGQHKIEPTITGEIVTQERSLPSVRAAGSGEFSVATFNVENLFDLLDPHPSDPPMPTVDEYHLKLGKIAEAIVAMGTPTIIGLQEVENIDVLEDLVEQEQLVQFDYRPILVEADDPRGIDVAYIVRGDQVIVEGFGHYPAPEGLTTRPPLVITSTLKLEQGDMRLVVLNNHFSSLASGEEATEPRRTAQAAWNATLVERFRQENPEAQFIVMGDLNSFVNTPPLEALEEAGLRHVYGFLGSREQWPYTYVFQGATQTLDHILVSEALFANLVLVEALHINADYPIMDPEDPSARHVSDHDPLVAIFSVNGSG